MANDAQSLFRVVEALHAIKILIETSKKLTDEDLKILEQIIGYMKRG